MFAQEGGDLPGQATAVVSSLVLIYNPDYAVMRVS